MEILLHVLMLRCPVHRAEVFSSATTDIFLKQVLPIAMLTISDFLIYASSLTENMNLT
jgi:hypothetical protein